MQLGPDVTANAEISNTFSVLSIEIQAVKLQMVKYKLLRCTFSVVLVMFSVGRTSWHGTCVCKASRILSILSKGWVIFWKISVRIYIYFGKHVHGAEHTSTRSKCWNKTCLLTSQIQDHILWPSYKCKAVHMSRMPHSIHRYKTRLSLRWSRTQAISLYSITILHSQIQMKLQQPESTTHHTAHHLK